MRQWTPDEIRAFRQPLNLYQKDVALLLRVTVQYVCNLEKGVRSPSNKMKALLIVLKKKETKKKRRVRNVAKESRSKKVLTSIGYDMPGLTAGLSGNPQRQLISRTHRQNLKPEKGAIRDGKEPEPIKRIPNYTFSQLAGEYTKWREKQSSFDSKKYFIKQLVDTFGNIPKLLGHKSLTMTLRYSYLDRIIYRLP